MPFIIWGGSALLSAVGFAGWGGSKAIHETKDIIKWLALAAIVFMIFKNMDVIRKLVK